MPILHDLLSSETPGGSKEKSKTSTNTDVKLNAINGLVKIAKVIGADMLNDDLLRTLE